MSVAAPGTSASRTGSGRVRAALYLVVVVAGGAFAGRELYQFYRLQTHPQPDIQMAVVRGDTETLRELLRFGADPDTANSRDETCLHLASGGHLEREERYAAINLLLRHGADPNRQDRNGNTPVQRMLMLGREHEATGEVVDHLRSLVEAGADINIPNNDGVMPLTRALVSRYDASTRFLLDHGAEVRLTEAVLLRDSERVGEIIRANPVAVNTGLADWTTPLMFALRIQDYGIVRQLVDAGASFKVQSQDGETPFHILMTRRGQDWETAMSFVRGRNLDPNARDQHGFTPFLRACQNAPLWVVREIAESGGDLTVANRLGSTPLFLAIFREDTERLQVVEYLLEQGADPNVRNSLGNAPLHYAADAPAIQLLLEHGADPDIAGRFGARPLGRLVARGLIQRRSSEAAIRVLLEHGADPNAGGVGEPALMFAVRNEMPELVALLLEYGADPDWSGPGKTSPRELAQERGQERYLAMFEEAGDVPTL